MRPEKTQADYERMMGFVMEGRRRRERDWQRSRAKREQDATKGQDQ